MLRLVYAIVWLGYARKIIFFPRLCSLLAPFRLPSMDFLRVSWFLRVSKHVDCPNCGLFCHKQGLLFVGACTNMIYRKLMIIGSNVTAGWQLVPQGNSVCLGAFGKMSGPHCRRFHPSPHPLPLLLILPLFRSFPPVRERLEKERKRLLRRLPHVGLVYYIVINDW